MKILKIVIGPEEVVMYNFGKIPVETPIGVVENFVLQMHVRGRCFQIENPGRLPIRGFDPTTGEIVTIHVEEQKNE